MKQLFEKSPERISSISFFNMLKKQNEQVLFDWEVKRMSLKFEAAFQKFYEDKQYQFKLIVFSFQRFECNFESRTYRTLAKKICSSRRVFLKIGNITSISLRPQSLHLSQMLDTTIFNVFKMRYKSTPGNTRYESKFTRKLMQIKKAFDSLMFHDLIKSG